MPYTLIIADDEEHIREGLHDLVSWNELGFRVVAKLEDGQDILDWIRREQVDVILTDIKMSGVSGLEVAAHVFDNGLSPKIVLISGYREFELAKQAVSCNVVDYLLKPTKLDEITHVFRNVKRKLDEEKATSEQLLHLQQQSDKLLQRVQPPKQMTPINKAKAYAAQHFDKDLSLRMIAEHVYLSPDYFSRLFKEHTGSNFTDYILELRMNKAMDYLANPQFKVYEIGPLVGYSNAKYFFKMFKKYTGFTPSEYRRKLSMEN